MNQSPTSANSLLELEAAPRTAENVSVESTPETKPPVIHTTILPLDFVSLDIEVRDKYLSDDLNTICEAAAKTLSPILIATAGFPLENREASLVMWRMQSLRGLATRCPQIFEFFSTNPELFGQFHDGTVDLLELDRKMRFSLTEKDQIRLDHLASCKAALRKALNDSCEGMPLDGSPGVVVVRASDGQMKLLKNPQVGKVWGRIGNAGFYVIPLAMTEMRRFLPE